MQILCLNFGTASLKFALFGADGDVVLEGHLEQPASVKQALDEVRGRLTTVGAKVDAVGHRVVHGGGRYTQPAFHDADLERAIEALAPLAPQHNPMALEALREAARLWPRLQQVAVFDTAFHASIPEHASCYAVPEAWRQAGVRRYGFHGLSHQHVMEAVSLRMGVPASSLRIISLHLGNGASACAIDRGHSADTSMGFTPMEGLIMGTRCGDLDPGVVGYVGRTLHLSVADVEKALYEDSGMKALSRAGSDLRAIESAAVAGSASALLALQAYAYRVRKYVGAYAAAMGGCDAIAFTGGVGENSSRVRATVLEGLEFLGISLDVAHNVPPQFDENGVAPVSRLGARTPCLIVRAREEWMIARETRRLLNARGIDAHVRN